jgi:hypothetical protein
MGTTSRRSRSVAHAVLSVGVTLAAVTAISAPASAASAAPQESTTSQAVDAAAWLAAQLAVAQEGSFSDPDVTAEAILALEATGTEESAAQQAVQWLLANAPDALGATAEESVSAYGKFAVTAMAAGVDPADFAGVDLLATLRSLECGPARVCDPDLADRADELGRFADGAPDDLSDVMSQAWAILALERASAEDPTEEGASTEAVNYLVANQCPDGGFPPAFVAHGLDDQAAGGPAACQSNPGVTGLVVQTLVLVGADCDVIRAAVHYLVSTRSADGSWSMTSGTQQVTTSTTTAWASLGLTAVGEDTNASRTYLTTLQRPDGSVPLTAGTLVNIERATSLATAALAQQSLVTVGTGRAAPTQRACGDAEPTPTTPNPTVAIPTTTTPTVPTTATVPGPTKPGRLTSTIGNPTGGTDLTNGGTELARTGAVSRPLAVTGGLLLAAGAGLVAAARRRPRSARS